MKTLKRTVKLESDFLNEWKYRVLREVEEHQRKFVNEISSYGNLREVIRESRY